MSESFGKLYLFLVYIFYYMKTKSFFLLTLTLIFLFQACEEKRPVIMGMELSDGIYAHIFTNKGNILTRLEYQKVPMTVASFVGLCDGTTLEDEKYKGKCFYDNILWHRVVPNFIIQAGDPNTLPGGNPARIGMGGPGYQFDNEIVPNLSHSVAGTLAMANSGPNTNGSQIYITHRPTPELDRNYSVFGSVARGMEVVNAIAKNDTIKTIKIIRVGREARKFDEKKIFGNKIAPGMN